GRGPRAPAAAGSAPSRGGGGRRGPGSPGGCVRVSSPTQRGRAMTEDRGARLWALFDQAADLPPEEQHALLDVACRDDAALRAEVERLLADDARLHADGGALAFLDSPVARSPTPAIPAPGPAPGPALPPRIGRYRILRLLGEGGMGGVYEAEQDNPRRAVALKVIRPGLVSPALL